MTITVEITDLTARQQAKLDEFFSDLNIQRQAQGKPPYTTLEAWAVDTIQDQIQANIRAFEVIEANIVKEAYIASGNAVQNQVKTALGL